MSGFDWFLVGFWVFGLVAAISATGKPRRPLEPGTVAIMATINLAMIAGLLVSRGVVG